MAQQSRCLARAMEYCLAPHPSLYTKVRLVGCAGVLNAERCKSHASSVVKCVAVIGQVGGWMPLHMQCEPRLAASRSRQLHFYPTTSRLFLVSTLLAVSLVSSPGHSFQVRRKNWMGTPQKQGSTRSSTIMVFR